MRFARSISAALLSLGLLVAGTPTNVADAAAFAPRLDLTVLPPSGGNDTTAIQALVAQGIPIGLIPGQTYHFCGTLANGAYIQAWSTPGYPINPAQPVLARYSGCTSGTAMIQVDSYVTGTAGLGTIGSNVSIVGVHIEGAGSGSSALGDDCVGPGSDLLLLRDDTITGCDVGVGDETSSDESEQFTIENTEIQNNLYGVYGSYDGRISDSAFTGQTDDGIDTSGGGNYIINTRVEWNHGFGINFFGSHNDTVVGGQVEENYKEGLSFGNSTSSPCIESVNGVMLRGNAQTNSSPSVAQIQISNCSDGPFLSVSTQTQLLGGNTVPQYVVRFTGTNSDVNISGTLDGYSTAFSTGTWPSASNIESPTCGLAIGVAACPGTGVVNATTLQQGGLPVATAPFLSSPGYTSGPWYTTLYSGTSSPTLSSANILTATPFYATQTKTFTKEAIYVTTGVAATNCELGVYNNNNGVPGSLLLDAGNVPVTSSSTLESLTGLSIPMVAGNWYWLATACNGMPALLSDSGSLSVLGNNGTFADYSNYHVAWTYSTGALPNPFTAGGSQSTGAALAPLVGVGF
jgi:hypothetical protein